LFINDSTMNVSRRKVDIEPTTMIIVDDSGNDIVPEWNSPEFNTVPPKITTINEDDNNTSSHHSDEMIPYSFNEASSQWEMQQCRSTPSPMTITASNNIVSACCSTQVRTTSSSDQEEIMHEHIDATTTNSANDSIISQQQFQYNSNMTMTSTCQQNPSSQQNLVHPVVQQQQHQHDPNMAENKIVHSLLLLPHQYGIGVDEYVEFEGPLSPSMFADDVNDTDDDFHEILLLAKDDMMVDETTLMSLMNY
jgi:hypothetical protein